VLISNHDLTLNQTIDSVITGKVKEINYKKKNDLDGPGGALAKSTSKARITDAAIAADIQYMNNLDTR
jgi:hypothetical protein